MTCRRGYHGGPSRAAARRRASGTTLLEMIAYVGILVVLVNLGAKTFLSHTRLSAMGTAGITHFDVLQDIRRDFTDTVRSSLGICPGVGAYRSNEAQLVLRMPTALGEAAAARYAIFGRMENPPYLYRLVIAQDANGALQAEHLDHYRRDLAAVRFDCAGPEGTADAPGAARSRLVALNLEPARQGRGDRPVTVHRFVAAARNTMGEETP